MLSYEGSTILPPPDDSTIGQYKEDNEYFYIVNETSGNKKPSKASKSLDRCEILYEKAEVMGELMTILCKENLRRAAIKQIAKGKRKNNCFIQSQFKVLTLDF